jgi:WD40 repeat protein
VTGGNRKLDEFSPTGSTIDLSRDGSLFAEGGGGGDAAIKITETNTGKSRYLVGHPGVVKTIAYSPDGSHLAVAGSDKNIYVFDAAGRSPSRELIGHVRPIDALAFNPDGQQLFSVDADETLKVWDWKKGEQIRETKSGRGIWGAKKVEFGKDGKYFLTLNEGTLKIWDARSLKLLREIKTAESYESTSGNMTVRYSSVPVSAAAFAGGGGRVLSTHADKTLRTWDALSGEQLASVDLGGETPFLCVSPDEKTVLAATGRGDKFRIRLLDVETGKELTTFDDEQTSYVEALAISPDGRRFATSDISGDVLLWDVNKSRPVHELDIGHSGDDALAFSPDGKTLAVGGGNQNLFLFDVESGDKLWQLIPSYEPSDSEVTLTREKEQRQAKLNEQKALRDRQAAADTEVFGKQVYITFEHYGDMTDPGELRMVESDEPRQSKLKKPAAESSAVWLRLHNDSPLPIKIPTQSMYLPNPKCFFQLPGGQKVFGLCDGREVSIWFGLEDKDGKALPYGFDFGSSAILLPRTSALFAVPREALRGGNVVRFDYSFQKEGVDGKVADYGEEIMLRFRESDLPKM